MDHQIAIIVPVYNDPDGIKTTVDTAMNACDRDLHFDLIVVDNNSTDKTTETAHELANKYPPVVIVEETAIQSSYAARNTGIRNTNAEILAFLDADMTVPDGWLKKAIDAFESSEADYIGTNVELQLPPDPPLAARYDHHTGFPVGRYLTQQNFAPTCCLFVNRSIFEEIGLYDPRLTSGGDKEFGNRVHEAGYELHYAEDITVYHPTRNSLHELVAKDRRVGRGLCQLQRYHPDRYGKPGIPPRPSGAKRPSDSVSYSEQIAFGSLGTMLTGMRGLGYYSELVSPTPAPDIDGIPKLD